jgi:hypothetical protein
MDQFFTDLGRKVGTLWKEQNFSLAKFPEIAKTAIDECAPSENVDVATLIKSFLLNDEQPFQTQSGFGQPELIVYDDPRFYIQLLFWLDGTTQIHQHEFSGAFHVLQGSSIHSLFEFDNAQSVSAHFRVGDLRVSKTEFLETGTTVPIVSGREYIHSLFHLETPSLTLVVRTHNDPGTSPQFTYLPPHVAVDPFFTDALSTRRNQLLDMLEKLDDPSYPELVQQMIESLDFERGFFVLQNGVTYLRNIDTWDQVWAAFREKHGQLSDYVVPTLSEIIWREGLISYRGTITDVEHRFFLALLLNVPKREDIIDLVSKSHEGDPIENIMRWVSELSLSSDEGTYILDAAFPQELDFPVEQQLEIFLAALHSFLAPGDQLEAFALSPADIAILREAARFSSLRSLVL